MPKNSGFTIIELLIILVIIGIMASVAVPSYQGMVARNALTNHTNAIVGFLQLARSEAVTRRTATQVCPSTNLTSCSGTNMALGAIILQGTTVLKVLPATTANLTSSGTGSLTYSSDGTSTTTGTWTVASSNSSVKSKIITVNATGRTVSGDAP